MLRIAVANARACRVVLTRDVPARVSSRVRVARASSSDHLADVGRAAEKKLDPKRYKKYAPHVACAVAAAAVAARKVAALQHELRDYAVKAGALVAEAKFSGAQQPEVLRRLGHNIVEEAEDDAAGLGAVDADVEVHVALCDGLGGGAGQR